MKALRTGRGFHRLAGVMAAAPFLIVILTGIPLLLRQELDWVQPKAATGSVIGSVSQLSLQQVFEAAKADPAAGITSAKDVSTLEYRPSRGAWSVRTKEGYEVQIDGRDARVLSSAPRRTSWLIELHQGTWFHPKAMVWVFLPSALLVLSLWFTGMWLWIKPYLVRRRLLTP